MLSTQNTQIKIAKGKDYKINNLIFVSVLAIISLIFIFLAVKSLLFSLGFVVLLAIILIFYQNPKIGVYLIILSILGGQLIKLNIGQGESGLLISDILIPFFVLIWLARVIIKKEKITSTFVGPFLFLFLSIAVLSFINGLRFLEINQAIISLFYLVRLLSYASLFYVCATIFSQDENGISRLKIFFLVVFVLFSLAGIFQLLYFPSLVLWAMRYGWDPHMGRLFSTFLDPNFAGAFLVIGFITSLALLFYTKSIEGKIIFSLATILTLVTTILTYSRSTYLFLCISFLVLSILRSKKLLFVGIAVIIILLILFPRSLDRIQGGFSIDESARARLESWDKTLTIARDHPLLGVGYNAFGPAQKEYSFVAAYSFNRSTAGADSSILLILATTGVVGLLSFIIFYIAALIKAKKVYNFSNSEQKKGFALAIIAILVGLIFHSIFVNSLLYPAIIIPIFIILGLTATKNRTE